MDDLLIPARNRDPEEVSMAEQWLSIVEYARTFQVSDMTVRRRIRTGKLHAVLKEGKYFIPIPTGEMRNGAHAASPMGDHASGARAAPRESSRPQFPEQRRTNGGEMQVIKGHPSPHRTLTAPVVQQNAFEPRRDVREQIVNSTEPDHALFSDFDESDGGMIPPTLRRAVQASDLTLVDSRALLAFCEATMRKVQDGERRQVERFKSKLEALEATVARRDLEIKTLNQQLEDLQLLVRVMERKRPA